MCRKSILIILIIIFSVSFKIYANDGAAGLDGGTLVFKKLKGVTMESEKLYISESLVTVKYVFFNKTSEDIKTIVAFPVSWIENCADLNFDSKDPNPLKFTVKVDNKKVPFFIEKRDCQK